MRKGYLTEVIKKCSMAPTWGSSTNWLKVVASVLVVNILVVSVLTPNSLNFTVLETYFSR